MGRFEKFLNVMLLAVPPLSACDHGKKPISGDRHSEGNALKNDTLSTPTQRVYAPMVFQAEGGPLRTSACLSFDEISPSAHFGGVEPTFNEVVQSFKAKDKKAYEALIAAEQQVPDAQCGDQALGFFPQFETVTSTRISHTYAFDNVVVVEAAVHRGDQDLTFPFAFARSKQGKLGFLPCHPQTLNYVLVSDWLTYTSPGNMDRPQCAPEVVEHATHRLPIVPDAPPGPALQLLLHGAAFDSPGDLRITAERVTATIKGIQQALNAKDPRALASHMTGEGGKQVSDWWPTAPEQERDRYADAITGQVPFFVFDASPLVIVYTRGTSRTQVMYFVAAAKDRLVWANSARISPVDKLFKRDPLFAAAALPNPFSNLRIK